MPNRGALFTFLHRIRWFNLAVLTITPAIGLHGLRSTPLRSYTLAWAAMYYVISMLGYHRLWSHRSYNASRPLQYLLVLMGASAVQGSVYWWARGHRSHHRYTDTPLDPYNAKRGLLYSHIGWMLIKPSVKPGTADISDLKKNEVVQWQHRWYFVIIIVVGYALPAIVAGIIWGDWWGGFYYAGMWRITFVHHSVFSINSLAHYLGETPFDDKKSARDHFVSALLTMGEGYHNFHHQFPMDYRNAVKWYQFDPTKWFIAGCAALRIASHLRVFPQNEVNKAELAMKLKKLRVVQDNIQWPAQAEDLPVVSWESFRKEAQERPLLVVSGFIHDVGDFLDQHPGGRSLIRSHTSKDATAAFCGGVYEHSNAAHNLLSMMRVGVLHGGVEHVDGIAPGERLKIVDKNRSRRRQQAGTY
ncbi:hypothetical protein L227DRAFT_511857 [Lentinus tigrinus ALCF2SS1-6]|uniref:Acyl-CoA desaturase n=1 Tax=Lentinus tigrinus ALCF2SS1-6 TaxID=1328759 RepID=A0A5C2RRZ7_9APHY|nr:hypothetical protein L227DRAFT_511857 [Lentinus tigrinus ALCF2SS1-6]